MKRFRVAALVLAAAVSARTQERRGTISGSVADPDGHALPTASFGQLTSRQGGRTRARALRAEATHSVHCLRAPTR
jgi:hypothetical protein